MLVLAAALGLLTLACVCVAAMQLTPAGDVHAARLVNDVALDDTPTATPDTSPPTATPTATHTSRRPTPTPTAGQTATPGATATKTPAAAGNNNGGGGATNGGGDTSSGPQPTKVVLSQPTVGTGGGGPLGAFNVASNGANGVWIASLLGCFTAVLGILVAAVALSVLVRGGYGPFLRALALGPRAAKNGKATLSTTSARFPAQASGRVQAMGVGAWDDPARTRGARDYDDELPRRGAGGLWEDSQEYQDYDDYGSARIWQARENRRPPSNPRTAPRSRGRSRADW